MMNVETKRGLPEQAPFFVFVFVCVVMGLSSIRCGNVRDNLFYIIL